MVDKLPITLAYTSHYQETCFEVWYSSGRPKFTILLENIPVDEYGRKPQIFVLRSWRDDLGWDIRADELDAKVSVAADNDLVRQRVLMLKEQAAKARQLQKLGMEYLEEEGFDSAASAVSAIIKGANLERAARGVSEFMEKMIQMDDKSLTTEVQALLERANIPPDVIDVSEVVSDEEDEE